jgi:hypothetical protein
LLTVVDGHYLNLPVMGEADKIVGMVDVLKLTYATLDQVSTIERWIFITNIHCWIRSTISLLKTAKAPHGISFGSL